MHLLYPPYGSCRNSLHSHVINQQSHEGIATVNIFIPEINRGTVTDDAGYYELKNVPEGRFKIQFSHIGFTTVINTCKTGAEAKELNMALRPSFFKADEIIITAPTYTAPEQTAYNITMIRPERMNTTGTITLTETLTEAAGINQLTAGIGIAKPVIRGLSGNRILTIINGFRFDNQQWQDEHGLGLSDIGVGRIEIIKAPALLLYGSDALGGVINLIDEKPAPYGQTVGDYNLKLYSNTIGATSDLGLRGSKESMQWNVRLGVQSNADYYAANNSRVPNTRFNGLDLKSGLGFIKDKFVSNWNYHTSLYQIGVVELEELLNGKKEERFEREMEGPHHTVNYHLLYLQWA
ncbi:TonB-dependent receptor [candidate division KSB1 bacterium]|nr:TonB-dependent receptor [candidate division KSB1 bacterium]